MSVISDVKLGKLVSPRAVTPSDLAIDALPQRVFPGQRVLIRILIRESLPGQSAHELDVSLGRIVRTLGVNASLTGGPTEISRLDFTAAPLSTDRCIGISLTVPADAVTGSLLTISQVTVAGQPIYGTPLRTPVLKGVHAPLRLRGAAGWATVSPSITDAGVMYAPASEHAELRSFDALGAALPPLRLEPLGLGTWTIYTAFAGGASPLVILGRADDIRSRVVALDASTHALRWTADLGSHCYGVAVLPTSGLLVALIDQHLPVVLSLADGLPRGEAIHDVAAGDDDPMSLEGKFQHIAADPLTGTVFTASIGPPHDVTAWAWNERAAQLAYVGVVPAAGHGENWRPLAVVPPSRPGGSSHLLVGTQGSADLRIIALPSLTLIHEHRLAGVHSAMGIAADPHGTAIAVADSTSEAIIVVPWPLPGMPELA